MKKTPERKDDLRINEAISEVIELARGEISKNGVELQTKLAEALPMIQGDRVQLQQVMLNLIMNGIEAMSGGEARSLVIASQTQGSRNVLVSVCDSGPGLDPDVASVAMVAMIERLSYYVLTSSVDIDRDQLLDTLTSILHVGVFAGTRARRSAAV